MTSFLGLETLPSIAQFFNLAYQSFTQEPTAEDLSRIFLTPNANGTNMLPSLFRELTEEYQIYNSIASCYLVQSDVEHASEQFFTDSRLP